METITHKIVDTTFLSACMIDIKTIDILSLCKKRYRFIIPKEVYQESIKSQDICEMSYNDKPIRIFDQYSDTYYNLLSYLTKRYPYLHAGELSSFITSIMEFHCKDCKYYYITDDKKMRSSIKKIVADDYFINMVGHTVEEINVTGTIGFLIRLKEIGLLNTEEIKNIKNDLIRGNFYLSNSILDKLVE